jgi:glycerol kinase
MLLNINTLRWDDELLKLFDIPKALLPEVVYSDSCFGSLSELEDITIHAVLGDQQAALFGQGCLEKGQLKSTYGTGCFIMSNVGDKPIHSDDGLLTTIGFSLNGKVYYAIEGSIYASGTTVQWLRDNLRFFDKSDQSETYLNEDGNANNVLFIPAFTGLGAPYWNSEIRASFHGITRDTSRTDLINAAFNSVTYQTKDIIDCLLRSGIEIESLNIDGGMVGNKTFVQQIANLLNIEVSVPENSESTARGVAVLAGVASKSFDLTLISNQKRTSITPDKDAHIFMLKDYTKWKKLIHDII